MDRRVLFGMLGAYLGGTVGLLVGIPLGFLAVRSPSLRRRGAVALPAETRRVQRVAIIGGMFLPTMLGYLLATLA